MPQVLSTPSPSAATPLVGLAIPIHQPGVSSKRRFRSRPPVRDAQHYRSDSLEGSMVERFDFLLNGTHISVWNRFYCGSTITRRRIPFGLTLHLYLLFHVFGGLTLSLLPLSERRGTRRCRRLLQFWPSCCSQAGYQSPTPLKISPIQSQFYPTLSH